MGLLLLFSPPSLNGATYWIAPPGSGYDAYSSQYNFANNTSSNPMAYTLLGIQVVIYYNPKATAGDQEVELVFTPKVYQAPDNYIYRIENLAVYNIPGGRTLTMRSDNANSPITLQLVPPTTTPSSFFNLPNWETCLMVLSENDTHTTTINVRDLILDANWPEWLKASASSPNATSPAYVGGFALNAMKVTASKGTIQGVVVKNCGSNGITPRPYWQSSGREGFPLWVIATKPTVVDNDWGSGEEATPWKIENCEVYPLHATHGGYCTSIHVQSPLLSAYPAQVSQFPNHRVAIVRRCQIRGNGAENGLGSVESFGVTYRDNMLVGVGVGLYHDTGKERNFTLENNAFLDVYGMASVGGPNCATDWFMYYNIVNNLVRLRGIGNHQRYEDYSYETVTKGTFSAMQPRSESTLQVGRFEAGTAWGLYSGGTDYITFSENRFTTRPLWSFYEPNPNQYWNAQWRAVDAESTDAWTHMPRVYGTQSTYANNRRSSCYMGFSGMTVIDAPTAQTYALDQGLTYTFVPGGTVGRVTPEYITSGLKGLHEVWVSEPTVSGNTATIQACAVYHPTTLDTLTTATVIESPSASPYQLQLALFDASGSQVTSLGVQSTDASNVRTFAITLPSTSGSQNLFYRAVVFRKTTSQSGFEEGKDAWTSAEIHRGTTLRFDRAPDVADDRQGKAGHFVLRRGGTGTAAFSFSLRALIKGATASSPNRRCANPPGLAGAGFQLRKADTTLVGNCDVNGRWTLSFPAGSPTMDLAVEPLAGTGDVVEYEAAQFVLDFDQSSAQSQCAIAPPVPRSTSFASYTGAAVTGAGFAVTIWDGPKYKFNRLYETYPCPGGGGSMLSSLVQEEPLEGATVEEESVEVGAEGAELSSMTPPAVLSDGWDADLDSLNLSPLPELVPPVVTRTSFETVSTDPLLTLDSQALSANTTSTDLTAAKTFVYAINNTPAYPRMAGYATMSNPGSLCAITGNFDVGGGWMVDFFEKMQVELLLGHFYGVDDSGNRVGEYNSRAWYLNASGSSGYELQALTPEYPGKAYSISPDGIKIVGSSSKLVDEYARVRPTIWLGPSTVKYDLGSFNGTSTTAPGAAYAVNDSGVVAGKAKYESAYYRAFRDATYGDSALDTLLPFPPIPIGHSTTLYQSVAYGVNSGGDVVGSSDTEVTRNTWWSYANETRAILWWAGSNTPVPLGTVYPIDPNAPVNDPGRSEAYGANRIVSGTTVTTMVVGTSWTTPNTDPNGNLYAAAFLVLNVPAGADWRTLRQDINMLNLNDAHLTYFPSPWDRSQWNLKEAKSINQQGVIVGNATFGANPYTSTTTNAWILVPQPEAQP